MQREAEVSCAPTPHPHLKHERMGVLFPFFHAAVPSLAPNVSGGVCFRGPHIPCAPVCIRPPSPSPASAPLLPFARSSLSTASTRPLRSASASLDPGPGPGPYVNTPILCVSAAVPAFSVDTPSRTQRPAPPPIACCICALPPSLLCSVSVTLHWRPWSCISASALRQCPRPLCAG